MGYVGMVLLAQLFSNQQNLYQQQRDFPQLGNQNIPTRETSPAFQQTDQKISDERPQKT